MVKFIKSLFKWTITPEEYKAWLKERYENNPELEFKDNY